MTTNMRESAFHDFEHAGWQRAADHYIDSFAPLTRGAADALLDAAHVRAGTRVLDVACGPGFVTDAAARRGAKAIGLDFSPAMIGHARRLHPSLVFREGDAQNLPFDAASFDAVVMNFGLLHLARPDRAIADARRVLAVGGRYAFTIWAAPEEAVGFGIVGTAVEEYGRVDAGLPEGPPMFQFSDPAECRRAMVEAGFRDVTVTRVPLTWTVPSADAVFDAVSRGGVRTAALLRAQTPDALQRIGDAVRRRVEGYRRGDRLEIPMPAVLAAGTRPQ